MKQIFSVPLCAHCLMHEITSWLTEKAGSLSQELVKTIYLELRDIKLEQGQCIVCKNDKISADCIINLLKVLEKYRASANLRNEFIEMFGFRD